MVGVWFSPSLLPPRLSAGQRNSRASLFEWLEGAGIVVVITDGLENCGGNVCKLARRLRVRGHKVQVHVIGFLLQGEQTATLNYLAGATHGTYVAANSLEGLKRALRRLLSCPQISGLSAPPLKF